MVNPLKALKRHNQASLIDASMRAGAMQNLSELLGISQRRSFAQVARRAPLKEQL